MRSLFAVAAACLAAALTVGAQQTDFSKVEVKADGNGKHR